MIPFAEREGSQAILAPPNDQRRVLDLGRRAVQHVLSRDDRIDKALDSVAVAGSELASKELIRKCRVREHFLVIEYNRENLPYALSGRRIQQIHGLWIDVFVQGVACRVHQHQAVDLVWMRQSKSSSSPPAERVADQRSAGDLELRHQPIQEIDQRADPIID